MFFAKKNLFITVAVLSALLMPAFCFGKGKKIEMPTRALQINTADGDSLIVNAEIAAKEPEREHGYMERRNIPDGTGMLFVFEKDQVLHFWMKNTPHPLSIAYIDSDGVIIDIFDMTPHSLSSVSSTRSVRYALEVPQGWFEKSGISTGDVVQTAEGDPIKIFQDFL